MDISTIEHSAITSENRASLQTHMEKFDSFEAAALDGMSLKGQMGKPFKLMESMDSLPDDASRADFTTKTNKLLGREFASDIAGLEGLDMKLNSTSDVMDESMAAAFKQFVVEGKISKADAQKSIGFYNKAMASTRERIAAATKAAEDQAATQLVADKRACNDALVAHEDFATQEVVDKQNILLHRALKDEVGISSEDAEDMSEFLNSREGSTNPVLRRILMKSLAPLAAESSTDGGDGKPAGGKVMSEAEQAKETAVKKVLGWK